MSKLIGFKNHIFLYSPDDKCIGIVVDSYISYPISVCEIHNLTKSSAVFGNEDEWEKTSRKFYNKLRKRGVDVSEL